MAFPLHFYFGLLFPLLYFLVGFLMMREMGTQTTIFHQVLFVSLCLGVFFRFFMSSAALSLTL